MLAGPPNLNCRAPTSSPRTHRHEELIGVEKAALHLDSPSARESFQKPEDHRGVAVREGFSAWFRFTRLGCLAAQIGLLRADLVTN
jgi:hypothetical protein